MSAGKSRQSRGRYLNADVISAVVRAEAPYGAGRCPGAPVFIGAALGCRAIGPPEAGEAQGARAR